MIEATVLPPWLMAMLAIAIGGNLVGQMVLWWSARRRKVPQAPQIESLIDHEGSGSIAEHRAAPQISAWR